MLEIKRVLLTTALIGSYSTPQAIRKYLVLLLRECQFI
jgi:hypothetical protein